MGKTNETQREAFERVSDELDRLARGLRKRDQEMLDALLADARCYLDAIHMANPRDPWIALLVAVCLAQQRALVDAEVYE